MVSVFLLCSVYIGIICIVVYVPHGEKYSFPITVIVHSWLAMPITGPQTAVFLADINEQNNVPQINSI